MDTFSLLLYLEIQIVCISAFALLLIKEVTGVNKSSERIVFCWLLLSCITTFTFDAAWSLVNGASTSGLAFLNYALNILYYASLSVNCYLWFLYSEFMQRSAIVANRQRQYLCAIPALVIVALALMSPFNGALFYLDDAGQYNRGPLHFLQIIICYSYLGFTAIKAFLKSAQAREYQQKRRLLVIAAFIVPVLVAGVIQTLIPGLPVVAAGSAVSVLLVFINLQDQRISVDQLTKINNRNQLMSFLETRIDRAQDKGEQFALYLMDVNGFKAINDRYGHLEGDRALVGIGQALRSLKQQRNTGVFRYGGDEFIVIEDCDSEKSAERFCHRIHDAIARQSARLNAPYSLTVSIGYALYDSSIRTPQELIKRADVNLYRNKGMKTHPNWRA